MFEIEIDDPGSTPFSASRKCHADLAHSATPGKEVTGFGVFGKFVLKCSVVIVLDQSYMMSPLKV